MAFTVDKQTLGDLNLLGKYKANSIFKLFNATKTRGGERLLEKMFQQPLTDAAAINQRTSLFRYFQEKELAFPVETELLEATEHYFSGASYSGALGAAIQVCRCKIMHWIGGSREYEMMVQGVSAALLFFKKWHDFFEHFRGEPADCPFRKYIDETEQIFSMGKMKEIIREPSGRKLSFLKIICYDHFLRSVCYEKIGRLMQIIYECDVYMSVSDIARKNQFCYARAHVLEKGMNGIILKNVYHPYLKGGVKNSIEVSHVRNVIFLTGANMAGKSTFMKSFAIAVYLAHMGFPVAAGSMTFSVQDGLYTSINVPDNLNMGYSHFYAEVLRVKQVAEEVAAGKNLVVIFDELFKGTNVKDAFDATVAVTEAFAAHRNCSFIISTHITEAGHTLQERCSNFCFVYLPTLMQGSLPTYTYKLQEGITNDRHGMMIINNERILEMIRGEAGE